MRSKRLTLVLINRSLRVCTIAYYHLFRVAVMQTCLPAVSFLAQEYRSISSTSSLTGRWLLCSALTRRRSSWAGSPKRIGGSARRDLRTQRQSRMVGILLPSKGGTFRAGISATSRPSTNSIQSCNCQHQAVTAIDNTFFTGA